MKIFSFLSLSCFICSLLCQLQTNFEIPNNVSLSPRQNIVFLLDMSFLLLNQQQALHIPQETSKKDLREFDLVHAQSKTHMKFSTRK